jgi:hypothetical protein
MRMENFQGNCRTRTLAIIIESLEKMFFFLYCDFKPDKPSPALFLSFSLLSNSTYKKMFFSRFRIHIRDVFVFALLLAIVRAKGKKKKYFSEENEEEEEH